MVLETLKELSYQWYLLLSQVQTAVAGPLQSAAFQTNIPAVSALLFGVLGSLSPCQMTGNASAIAYLAQRSQGDERAPWQDAGAFVWGKMAVYLVLGAAAILLGLKLPSAAMAVLRKLFGPVMIIFGLYLLRLIRPRFTIGERISRALERRLPGHGSAGAFGLGVAYSLSFCPTMALLFFGLLVPLGLRAPAGAILPAFFAVGTALPLLAFAAFLSLGRGVTRDWLRRVRGVDRYVRWIAGVVIILLGMNDSILYWFL